MLKRRVTAGSGGSAAKKPAPSRDSDGSRRGDEGGDGSGGGGGGGGGGDGGGCATSIGADAEVPWRPSATELKPALDAVRTETGLLPELTALIAAFCDLSAPRWIATPLEDWCLQLSRPLGSLPRRLRFRVLGPATQSSYYWTFIAPHATDSYRTALLSFQRQRGAVRFRALIGSEETPAKDIELKDAVLEVDIVPTGRASGVLTARIGTRTIVTVAREDLSFCTLFRNPHGDAFEPES